MVIPLIIFLDNNQKMASIDYLYLFCFILIFIPFTLGKVSALNNVLGKDYSFPLTYGVLIQNIVISVMTISLITEGLITEQSKKILKSIGSFLANLYGFKSKDKKARLLTAGKILLTVFVFVLIFGDNIFSLIYQFKITHDAPFEITTIYNRDFAYMSGVEPYYLHYGDQFIIRGTDLNKWFKNQAKFMTGYGEINPNYCSETYCVFSVPLGWKFGKIRIWEQTFLTKANIYRKSNAVEIDVLDRLGNFNNDDVKYFGQIKYLSSQAQDINNFTNYKLRNIKFSRFIPTRIFQVYADTMELIGKINIIHKQ